MNTYYGRLDTAFQNLLQSEAAAVGGGDLALSAHIEINFPPDASHSVSADVLSENEITKN